MTLVLTEALDDSDELYLSKRTTLLELGLYRSFELTGRLGSAGGEDDAVFGDMLTFLRVAAPRA